MGQIVFQATLGGQTALVGQNTASSFSLNLPLANDTLVGKATTDTLTNKTIAFASNTFSGSLSVSNGGTGISSLTAGYIPYGNGTSAFSSSSSFAYNGSSLNVAIPLSPWDTYNAIQVQNMSLASFSNGDNRIVGNAYYQSPNWKYQNTGPAVYQAVEAASGFFSWNRASSGTAGTNITWTEIMRTDTSGNLLVGATSTTLTNGGILSYPGSGANSYLGIGHSSSGTSGSYYEAFNFNGTTIGTITQNGTTGVLYNLTSDYRLKDNPQPLIGASEFIMALRPKTWDWWDGSGKGVGFIAHEFMEIAKYSGHGEKDAVDDNGKPVYQSIQPSSSEVMANLVGMVQEQQALIESLTTRLTALESK